MRSNKNHEGYHDPTACVAVQRASRRYRYKRKNTPFTHLIGEKEEIRRIRAMLR